MANEQFLIVLYIIIGLLSLGFAILTYIWLRGSFDEIMNAVSDRLSVILKRLFFIGIVLPAMAGFFSVSFRSCSKQTYANIIADRSYLIAKNQEQLSTSLTYIVIALFVWGVIVLGALMVGRSHKVKKARD
ncbi:MAG: hypothetical protein MUP22_09100 [Desulfobacterales bacterium]|nr:hypothetical protein [Desulfobacterales bacterium]